jgi:hypothetical protein
LHFDRGCTFFIADAIFAVGIFGFLICAAYFVLAFFSPIPLQSASLNHFTYALYCTIFMAPGLCFFGTIPALLGNVVSQLIYCTIRHVTA